jgi:hypothetical protein
MITTVTRRHEHEMTQAIGDLIERGFTVIYGPEEKKINTTTRGNYNYRRGRYQSVDKGTASFWIAKLKKEGRG